jgi:hypothetical protein
MPPHYHVLQLDGLCAPGRDGGAPILHPAPGLTQKDVEAIVERASKRILRFLQRRGVITLVTAPGEGAREARGLGGWRGGPEVPEGGDGEVTVVADQGQLMRAARWVRRTLAIDITCPRCQSSLRSSRG